MNGFLPAIIFLILLSIFAVLYFLLKKNIRDYTSQLNKINNEETNAKILVSSSDADMKKLALSINDTIDEKKKVEAEYKRIDMELRRAIANVSHDLRTPLTSISGYIELIDDKKTSEEDKKHYIDIIKRRTKSLRMLIEGFYELSRLDSNEYKFELKPVNLADVLCDITVSFYNDFVNKGIEPKLDIDEKSGEVMGDENAIRRVFSNLIQNVLRYGKKDVVISLKKTEDSIVTIFENDAQNLTKEDASHLFERFFTADRARNGQGTGLGLAITKRLVESMGHKISLEFKDEKLSIIIYWKTL